MQIYTNKKEYWQFLKKVGWIKGLFKIVVKVSLFAGNHGGCSVKAGENETEKLKFHTVNIVQMLQIHSENGTVSVSKLRSRSFGKTYGCKGPFVNHAASIVDESITPDVVAIIRPGTSGVISFEDAENEKENGTNDGEKYILKFQVHLSESPTKTHKNSPWEKVEMGSVKIEKVSHEKHERETEGNSRDNQNNGLSE